MLHESPAEYEIRCGVCDHLLTTASPTSFSWLCDHHQQEAYLEHFIEAFDEWRIKKDDIPIVAKGAWDALERARARLDSDYVRGARA